MITPSNLVRHELIGLRVKADCAEAGHAEGRVIDESRNMLVIDTKKGEKRMPKEHSVFSFYLPDSRQWVRVDGKVIVARPEDRIKKRLEKW